MHRTEPRLSRIHGQRLFVTEDVSAGEYLIEYTGVRRSGPSARALHREMDNRGVCLDGFVTVNVDEGDESCIIDPRRCGNNAQLINHSCQSNCLLLKVSVVDRYTVKILSLADLKACTESTCNFGRKARATRNRIR